MDLLLKNRCLLLHMLNDCSFFSSVAGVEEVCCFKEVT